MKKKALILFLATITATALLFTGCGNKENETTPVAEEIIEEIEAIEPEEIEPVEEDNLGETNIQVGSDVKVDGELVNGTALTQEEIDELKATATTDFSKLAVEIYESITRNGSWEGCTKAVGKPDGSWRRMTDEEAKKILETADPSSDEYLAAKAELEDRDFFVTDYVNETVYFDWYAWADNADKDLPEDFQKVMDEMGGVEVAEPGKWDHLFN